MKGTSKTTAAIVVAVLAMAAPAHAEDPIRESYVAQLEPLCHANRKANERIMAGAKARIHADRLVPAGKQFVRVSRSLGGLVKQIEAVPPPAADSKRVETWIKFMRLLESRLRNVGKYLEAEEKVKATHESIQAERSGNTANNISFPFHFKYCRLGRVG